MNRKDLHEDICTSIEIGDIRLYLTNCGAPAWACSECRKAVRSTLMRRKWNEYNAYKDAEEEPDGSSKSPKDAYGNNLRGDRSPSAEIL